MADPVDARRRWFGLFYLVLAAGMLIWGETVLRSSLKGLAFLMFWMVCFIFTALAILIALLDMRATRRRIRQEQRELLEHTWEDLNHKPDDWDKTK